MFEFLGHLPCVLCPDYVDVQAKACVLRLNLDSEFIVLLMSTTISAFMQKKENYHYFFVVVVEKSTLHLSRTILGAYSADDKLMIFFFLFLFSQKTGFAISCKLSALETICMKSQILFGNNLHEMANPVFWHFMICMKCQIPFSGGKKIKMVVC